MKTVVLLLVLRHGEAYEFASFSAESAMRRCELTKELLLESLTQTQPKLECRYANP